jgi:hypothetical protein
LGGGQYRKSATTREALQDLQMLQEVARDDARPHDGSRGLFGLCKRGRERVVPPVFADESR